MTGGGRYQSHEVYYRQDDVTVFHGTDPLNGLAVLVYEFPGAPDAAAEALESEHIPGVLATSFDGARGRVVTAYSPRYELVAPGESVVDDAFALAFARALRDAEAAKVVHGDLRPGRLLFDQGHVLVEGYGVPWHPTVPALTAPEALDGMPPSPAGDVFALGATLEALGIEGLSPALQAVLATTLEPDPARRPSAAALYQELRSRAAGATHGAPGVIRVGAVMPPSRWFDELTLPTAAGEGRQGAAQQGGPADRLGEEAVPAHAHRAANRAAPALDLDLSLPDETARPAAGAVQRPPAPYGSEPDPITLTSDPGLTPAPTGGTRSVRDSSPGFVRDLPPGVTYRAGTLDTVPAAAPIRVDHLDEVRPPRRGWRGPLLFLLVLLVVGSLVALVFVNRGEHVPAPVGRNAVSYIVDVHVRPAGLPPVTLVVVASPAGSSTPTGTILGNAPRKVLLDRSGEWVLQAEFQDRRSQPATLRLPDDREVTVVFPDPTAEPRNP